MLGLDPMSKAATPPEVLFLVALSPAQLLYNESRRGRLQPIHGNESIVLLDIPKQRLSRTKSSTRVVWR